MMEQLLQNLENIDSNIPTWAQILIEGMKVVINELKCVKDLARKVEELESFKTVNETISQNLLNENKRLNERLTELELCIDDQEQRNRNYCLMLHGVEEKDGENTDDIVIKTVVNELEIVDFSLGNIQRSHRVGPRSQGRSRRNNRSKPRPIIFRLSDFRVRQAVFKKKKMLKGKGMTISENLTQQRMQLLKLAQEKYGFRNIWSIEGRVMMKVDDKFVYIKSEADLV